VQLGVGQRVDAHAVQVAILTDPQRAGAVLVAVGLELAEVVVAILACPEGRCCSPLCSQYMNGLALL
jgi:hypothetical protein